MVPRLDHAEFYLDDKGEKKFRHTRLKSFNLRMKNKLGAKFHGNKIIHPCHFLPHDRAHLNDFGKKTDCHCAKDGKKSVKKELIVA